MQTQQDLPHHAPLPRCGFRVLSAASLVLAFSAFIAVFAFLHRALPDDALAAVASALIGSVFLIATVASLQYANRPSEFCVKKSRGVVFSNRTMRCIAAVLGTTAVMGGGDFVYSSFIILNQEYLHWFKVSSRYSTNGSQEAWIKELAVEGLAFCTIGFFLLWYAVHPVSRIKSHMLRVATAFNRTPQAANPDSTVSRAPEDIPGQDR